MKKNTISLIFFRLVLTMMLIGGTISAQSHAIDSKEQEAVIVSYNTPFSYLLDDSAEWQIKNNNGEILKTGSGNISNIQFSVPGKYHLFINEKHNHIVGGCEHNQYPSQIDIMVSPDKITFDFTTIKFSKNIMDGQSLNDVLMTVDAVYSSYQNKTFVYTDTLKTAGVGTSIIGKLKNGKAVLKPGLNKLEFLLNGTSSKGNNIMLDFRDTNGQVHSYTLTLKIK